MVRYENIRATVIRYENKEPYPEYGITQDAAKRSQNVKEAYVEVVSGERFAVVVDISPEFDFQSSSHIRIRYSADGMAPKSYYISKKSVTTAQSSTANDERQRTWELSSRKIDGRWMKCALVFTDLQLDEESEPSADQISHEVEMYGKITIQIERGTRESCEPRPWKAPEIQAASSASKDVVKKSHISNTMKMLGLEEVSQPLSMNKFTPAGGKNSAPLKINLFYRSRSALELLKVIPTECLVPYSILPSPATGDSRAIVGTKRAAPKFTLKLGRRTTQPAPKNQSAPGPPLDAGDNAECPPHKKHKAAALPRDFSDDDEELPPKQKTGLGDQISRPEVDRERQSLETKSAKDTEHQNQIPVSNTPVSQSNPPPSINQTPVKPDPIIVKAETKDEDDDLIIVSATPAPRAHSTSVPTQAGDQAQRERKKAILNKRLEQLKIEREQLKIEQELLEMDD